MSDDILKRGSILRIETVTGSIYYCMWRKGDKGLYQYRKGMWTPNKKGQKIVEKKSTEWYDVLTANMKEAFTTSEVLQDDFITVLRKDTNTPAIVKPKRGKL